MELIFVRLLAFRLAMALALSIVVGAAAQDKGGEKADTPAAQYRVLLREFQLASSGGALTDEQRRQFIGRVFKLRNQLAVKFVELAEKYPQDPIALDALMQAVWQVNTTPWPSQLVGADSASARAFALLQRDHLRSDRLGAVCERISFGFAQEYETFLRKVLRANPHKHVQAAACVGLAHFLSNRLQRLDLIRSEPEWGREFSDLFGRAYLEGLKRQNPTRVRREAETLLERALREYGEIEITGGGTVGTKARAELFELRHLFVGKEAPDIEGADQDGITFKLRDFRGRVVLLDFWHQQ